MTLPPSKACRELQVKATCPALGFLTAFANYFDLANLAKLQENPQPALKNLSALKPFAKDSGYYFRTLPRECRQNLKINLLISAVIVRQGWRESQSVIALIATNLAMLYLKRKVFQVLAWDFNYTFPSLNRLKMRQCRRLTTMQTFLFKRTSTLAL